VPEDIFIEECLGEETLRVSSKLSRESVGSWKLNDLGSFYVANKSQFLSHARRLLSTSERAEEVVHEALLKVILAAPELNSENHAKAYVHRTIENLCLDIFRLEGRQPKLVLIDDTSGEIEEGYLLGNSDISEEISKAEDAAIVRKAISLLSPAERAAIVMWEIEERSSKEIARELGIKESSVKHTISRARASLRKILANVIFDEDLGLTGLDMLSRTYKQTKKVVQKSSKIALSILIFVFVFSGIKSFSVSEVSIVSGIREFDNSSPLTSKPFNGLDIVSRDQSERNLREKSGSTSAKSKSVGISFPGLGKLGIPTGFTIADSTGAKGPAFFRERSVSYPASFLSTSQIIKTEAIAANIFISQSISVNGDEIAYEPVVAYGSGGTWVPLLVRVAEIEKRHLADGNYLLTVALTVESEVEVLMKIEAKAGGRDLDVAPARLVTRVLLDSSKTQVLSQAVYVIESEAGA